MKLLIDFLLVAGILTNMVILLLLLRRQQQSLPRQILSFIFFSLFFVHLNAYGELHQVNWIYLIGFLFSDSIGYLIGPLLVFYINSIYVVDFRLNKSSLLHFIPLFSYFFVVTLPIVSAEASDNALPSYLLGLLNSDLFLQFQALYLLLYCGLAWRMLNAFRKKLKHAYTQLEDKDLRWVRHLLLGIVVTISSHLGLTLYESITGSLGWSFSYLSTSILIFFIIYLAYYGLEQSRILLPESFLEIRSKERAISKGKSPNSDPLQHFQSGEIDFIHRRILSLLEEGHIYLNEELTLGRMAQDIPTTDKKLSTLINHHLHTNFYDLINAYRVQVVKQKLAAKEFEHLTILAIAFDSGFKSKTSFNRIFKKETGMSPSAYKKHLSL
ncbi:MAG: AraC family transcriptional regulator [Saprospiraceae bacterium]|nr:AraC family transcriptional regulator [Saprospiraceae bacterium]